ncbi:hypothetical protein [Devosia sp. DBB001]|nr:hypothetical protein [Devosia sp. DBB001]
MRRIGDDRLVAFAAEQAFGQFEEIAVVIDEEQALALDAGRRGRQKLGLERQDRRGRIGALRLGGNGGADFDRARDRGGQADGEARAIARLAFDRDGAAHEPAEILAQRQTEAGAAIGRRDTGIGLGEAGEELALLLLRNADAGIGHGDLDPAAIGIRQALGRERDLAVLRELGSVGDKVVERLPQLGGVGLDEADLGPVGDRETVGVLGGERTRGGLDIGNELIDIDGLDMQHHLAGLDLGDIEDVVDHGEQVLAGGADLLEIGNLLAAPIELGLFEQELGIAEHGIERRAQLMAHLGEELGLGAIGALGIVLGVDQHLGGVAMPLDLAHQLGLAVHDIGVIGRHHEGIGGGPEHREHAGHDHIGHRHMHGEARKPVAGIEDGHAAENLGEDEETIGPRRAEIEKGEERREDEPDEEGRTRAAVIERAPENRKAEVAYREHRERRVVAREELEQRQEEPEAVDRGGEDMDVRPGLRIDDCQADRDGRGDERPEDVADEEHLDALAHVEVRFENVWSQPVGESFQPRQSTHGSLPISPVRPREATPQPLRSRKTKR